MKHEPHAYVICLGSLTLDEIGMKKDLNAIYENLGYEEGFGHIEVKSSF